MHGDRLKEIVVTGASSGIGMALARRLAAPGCRLTLIARSADLLEELASELRAAGAETRVCPMDLSDIESCGIFLDRITRETAIDELYLSAAVSIFGEVKDLEDGDWDRVYLTDLLSYAQWIQAVYARMAEARGGRIVIMSSLAAYAGYPTSVPYAAMKAGLMGLYRTLKYEAPRHGIRVHLVSPGYVRTGIYRSAIYRGATYESTLRQIDEMGFGMIDADEAADYIIKGLKKGRKEIVFPGYARLLAWVGPRLPWLVRPIHGRMVKRFRELSS